MTTEPWINPDGSTNVDGWLTAYAEDDNNFWRTETGHLMNVVDELIDRLDNVEERVCFGGSAIPMSDDASKCPLCDYLFTTVEGDSTAVPPHYEHHA